MCTALNWTYRTARTTTNETKAMLVPSIALNWTYRAKRTSNEAKAMLVLAIAIILSIVEAVGGFSSREDDRDVEK
jgi:hypothetical protein